MVEDNMMPPNLFMQVQQLIKGNAPTSEGKESGGTSFKISKGKVTGSTQGVGAAKKQKYTWI